MRSVYVVSLCHILVLAANQVVAESNQVRELQKLRDCVVLREASRSDMFSKVADFTVRLRYQSIRGHDFDKAYEQLGCKEILSQYTDHGWLWNSDDTTVSIIQQRLQGRVKALESIDKLQMLKEDGKIGGRNALSKHSTRSDADDDPVVRLLYAGAASLDHLWNNISIDEIRHVESQLLKAPINVEDLVDYNEKPHNHNDEDA